MKKNIIIPALAAMTLMSCGGGTTTQNNNTDTTAGGDVARNVSTTTDTDDLADVPEKFINFVNNLPGKPDKPMYSQTDSRNREGYYSDDDYFYAYPIKSGGYVAIFEHEDISEESGIPKYEYKVFTFKDGKLKHSNEYLPIKDTSTIIGIAPTPDKPEIRIRISNQTFDNMPVFKWNGEKFEPTDKFAEFMKSLPASPDKPIYKGKEEYGVPGEMCGVTETYYALPMKDGGYLGVLDFNEECEASMDWSDDTYIYKNGKITKEDGILPIPDVNAMLDPEKCKGKDDLVKEIVTKYTENPRAYILYGFGEDGGLSCDMSGNGCEQWGEIHLDLMKPTYYNWDGEKFVPENSTANNSDSKNIYGDINQDGIKDVIVYTAKDLNVCILNDKDVATYDKTFKVEDEYSDRLITEVTINDKGVIVIKTTWTNERGADGDDDYTVRFQDGDLYLIGYDSYYKPATNVSYNLLTYKKITKEGMNDDDLKTKTETLKNRLPLHKLSDIKIGEYICEDYDGLE